MSESDVELAIKPFVRRLISTPFLCFYASKLQRRRLGAPCQGRKYFRYSRCRPFKLYNMFFVHQRVENGVLGDVEQFSEYIVGHSHIRTTLPSEAYF